MNYLECVMSSAYTTIFFIDDKQRVSTADYGTSEAILALAKKFGADVEEDTLKTEFRCLGGNAYISWVDGLLYGNEKRSFAGDYDFRVFDDVTKMHQAIIEKDGEANASLPSRVVAGYCWDWISKKNSALHGMESGWLGWSGCWMTAKWSLTCIMFWLILLTRGRGSQET